MRKIFQQGMMMALLVLAVGAFGGLVFATDMPTNMEVNAEEISIPYTPAPVYPADAYEEKVEGEVHLEGTVLVDGKVTDVAVVHSSGDERLDQAAADAFSQWILEPFLRDGKPFQTRVRIKIEFKVPEEVPNQGEESELRFKPLKKAIQEKQAMNEV